MTNNDLNAFEQNLKTQLRLYTSKKNKAKVNSQTSTLATERRLRELLQEACEEKKHVSAK